MADLFSALISAADFIFNVTNSPIFNDSGIGDRGNDPEMLALRIQNIKNKLYSVDELQLSDLQKRTFQNLRVAVLDAEDILDREETLAKKKQLKEADEVITHETNGTEILSSLKASFQSSANKAWDMLCSWNKADEMKIKEMLDAIDQELPTIEHKEPSNSDLSWKRVRASGSQVNATRIAGRDADMREVIKLLLSSAIHKEKILVVSVVGIGGMGKTTLAQLVYEDKAWQGSSFDLKIWVSDSKQFDMKSLLKSILKSISPNEGSISIIDRLEEDRLKERLVQEIRGKRFFLVLDDVENENPLTWEELEVLLNYGSKEESRILVTTRSRKVAKDIMGSLDSTYPLKGLSEEESMQLFERYAFQETRDENLVAIGKLIVEKCVGVPLAIKVIGSLLRGKDKRKWELVRDSGLAKLEVKSNQLMPILKMSYDDLDPILKQCFSYCSLFPKNYRIPKEILSSIWMANVRFKTDTGESIEDICNENLEILYNRCFLEVEEKDEWDDDTYFKMHDLMHDLVKEVGGSEVVLESKKLIIEENVRHLSIFRPIGQRKEIYQFKGRRLRTYLDVSCYSWEWEPFDLNKHVSDCPVLRFLDLKSWRIGILTDSIGMLIHLRYLDLSRNEFQTLPDSITELINLKDLKLNGCHALTRLPSRMGALTSLEVLHLSYCGKLKELPMGIEKLINLKDLKLKKCSALTQLPPGMGALTSLQVLDLAWSEKLTQLPPGMGALTSLQVLNMSYCEKLEEFPMGIEKLTNLKDLNFEWCQSLNKMPSGMGALMPVCRPARFIVGHPESKHTAQLEELESFSELPQGELKIKILKNMKMTLKAPTGDGEAFLLNKKGLRRLEIYWTREENGEEVVPKNHMDILAKLQPPPNLQEFGMWYYQGTTFPDWVPKEGFAAVLPNLIQLTIIGCGRCRHLPPISRLPHLKYMRLACLDSLEYIEDDDVSGASFCASLETLELWDLPELRGWCSTTGTIEQQELLMLPPFPRLLDLHIHGCPKLRVEPILVSIAKGISVKSEVEKELSEKKEQTLPSFVPFFVNICRKGWRIRLQMEEEKCEPPLALESSHLNAPDKKSMNGFKHLTQLRVSSWSSSDTPSMNMFVGALIELSKHLTHLQMWFCSGLKTLPGGLLQHLTALQELEIGNCSDFTGKEEEEEKQIQSASLETLKIGDSSISLQGRKRRRKSTDSEMSWKGLQSLRSLTFYSLPKMEELPEGIQLLNSLKVLDISHCDNLRVPEWLPKTFRREGYRYTRLAGHENRSSLSWINGDSQGDRAEEYHQQIDQRFNRHEVKGNVIEECMFSSPVS